MAIVDVHFAFLFIQRSKSKNRKKLNFFIEFYSVSLSFLFVAKMNGKRWNEAQCLAKIKYLGFNVTFLFKL